MLENNPENVKIVFKNFPLNNHKFAKKAAVAALAAQENGDFWSFHDQLFEKSAEMSDQVILDIALKTGFTKEMFEQKLQDPGLLKKVNDDIKDGRKANVRGVPAVFINGKLINKRTLEMFQFEIDKELNNMKK